VLGDEVAFVAPWLDSQEDELRAGRRPDTVLCLSVLDHARLSAAERVVVEISS
jgi:hypothetical protein